MSDTGLNSPETSRQPQRLPEIDTRPNPSDPEEQALFDQPMIQSFQSWGPTSEKTHCLYPFSCVFDTLRQLDRDAFPEHLRQHVQDTVSILQWLSSPDLFDEAKSIVLTAIQQRNLDLIRSAQFYQPPTKTVSDFVEDSISRAIEGGERLKCILEKYMRSDPVNYYARFTTFWGHVVTVPACLADETSDPFPPRDKPACGFLVTDGTLNAQSYIKRTQAFFYGMFTVAHRRLQGLDTNAPLASTFQDLMTSGMQFGKHNPYRIRFFEEVVECATDFLHRSTSASHATANSPITYTLPGDSEDTIVTAGSKLVEFIRARQPLYQSPLTLLLCFDKAHPLLRHRSGWTPFFELRRSLRKILRLQIFTLFLSTTGSFYHFTPPPVVHPSSRLITKQLRFYRSITAVDFDILAKKVKLAEEPSLHKLASTDFIAHLGRPLFGTRYDMKGHHATGVTLTLQIHRKRWLASGSGLALFFLRKNQSWEKREVERKQVERHMRLCLAFDPTALVLETISPSEPLLAEAARDVMRDKTFAPSLALSSHITNSSIDIGMRGEMIAALWWILARDQAVAAQVDLPPNAGPPSTENDGFQAGRIVEVPDLLKALIDDNSHNRVLSARPFAVARDEERERSLQDAFSGCYVYFNHFVRVVDRNTLDQDHLWRVFCRGAAIICVVDQQGIDILTPILRGYILKKENIGVILIQVKNDKRYGSKLNGRLFDAINPQRLGLCAREPGHQIPIIRVVMALASEFPAVQPRTPPAKRSKRLQAAKYTAYDLWLAGRTADTYKPIAGEASAVYDGLLRGLAANYDRIPPELSEPLSSKLETVYRRMNAAAGYDAEYYDFYTEYDDENGEDEDAMALD
ncbi:hypothetical protein ONZ45_g5701 [Pleurotus djamor]|nr:hypothetical protein ONZ45_g5701 [Pleurotus djamor]